MVNFMLCAFDHNFKKGESWLPRAEVRMTYVWCTTSVEAGPPGAVRGREEEDYCAVLTLHVRWHRTCR